MTTVIESRKEFLLVIPGRARSFRSPVASEYADTIRAIAQDCITSPFQENDIEVRLDYFYKGRRRVDMDNVSKLALDALNSVAYFDDRQVRIQSSRSHCVDEVVSIHREVFDIVKPLRDLDEYMVIRVNSADAAEDVRSGVTT